MEPPTSKIRILLIFFLAAALSFSTVEVCGDPPTTPTTPKVFSSVVVIEIDTSKRDVSNFTLNPHWLTTMKYSAKASGKCDAHYCFGLLLVPSVFVS